MSSLGGKALLGWCECLLVGCACAFSVCAQRMSVSVWQRRGSRPSHARPAGGAHACPAPSLPQLRVLSCSVHVVSPVFCFSLAAAPEGFVGPSQGCCYFPAWGQRGHQEDVRAGFRGRGAEVPLLRPSAK